MESSTVSVKLCALNGVPAAPLGNVPTWKLCGTPGVEAGVGVAVGVAVGVGLGCVVGVAVGCGVGVEPGVGEDVGVVLGVGVGATVCTVTERCAECLAESLNVIVHVPAPFGVTFT